MADLIDRAPMLEFLDLQHYDKDMYVTQYNPEWIYSWLESAPAVNAVEVTELLELRDILYETDGITMKGLKMLNEMIARHDRERKEDD